MTRKPWKYIFIKDYANSDTGEAENLPGRNLGQRAAYYRTYLTWDSSKSFDWLLDFIIEKKPNKKAKRASIVASIK